MHDSATSIVDGVELLLVELDQLASQPTIHLLHRFRQPGTRCMPGEEIAAAWIPFRRRQHDLGLAPSELGLLDYLGRHRLFPQTAAQIEAGMMADRFYRDHSSNSGIERPVTIRMAAVRVYVARICDEVEHVCREVGINVDSRGIIESVPTTTNVRRYQLRVPIICEHQDMPWATF